MKNLRKRLNNMKEPKKLVVASVLILVIVGCWTYIGTKISKDSKDMQTKSLRGAIEKNIRN